MDEIVSDPTTHPSAQKNESITTRNRQFYDRLWSGAKLIRPESFLTWKAFSGMALEAGRRLEIGPGLRPRLPLEETDFFDLSREAVGQIRRAGGRARTGSASDPLPYEDDTFGLICALDIVEHVEDDHAVLSEIARVAAPGARLIISAPLHADRWIPFDDLVGHCRRYDPDVFFAMLEGNGFTIEESAGYGMQPKSSRLLDFGMRFLARRPREGMWWYNNVFMPIGLMFQSELKFAPGTEHTRNLDEVLLICRKTG